LLEFWNDVKDEKTKILLNPLFQEPIILLFQMGSKAMIRSITRQKLEGEIDHMFRLTWQERGTWMSFFAPNWAGAMSLLFPDDPGGRPSPAQTSISGEVDVTLKAARPPLSAA